MNVKYLCHVDVCFETGDVDVVLSECLHHERGDWFMKWVGFVGVLSDGYFSKSRPLHHGSRGVGCSRDADLGSSCDGRPRAAPWEDLRCSTDVLACLLPGDGSAGLLPLLIIHLCLLGGSSIFIFLQQENHLKMWNITLVILGWKMIYIAQKSLL